jgi:hypothetical protein
MIESLKKIKKIGYKVKKFIETGDFESFGFIMNDHWHEKKKRSKIMSNSKINYWYEGALKNGAIGGKLVGAGGGGFLMFYAKDKEMLQNYFLNLAKIPVLPPSRPTDIIEQIIIGFGAPPPARIVYSLFWKYFKGVPKTPLIDKIMPMTELSSAILTKIPWPIAALLGRDVINIMNPMVTSDDHPAWRRMSLKNVYYVVYIDEFIRSAADVSGLFKFFLGTDLTYPIPDLMKELNKKFNLKKY